MYESFTGDVIRSGPTEVILEVQGIAYRFAVPLSTSRALPREGKTRLLAHLVVREDKLDLVGFSTEPERTLFRHLLSVSGIGPAVALSVLSRAPVSEFVQAVREENRAYLNGIKGVGKKTVDRILVELGEPLSRWDLGSDPVRPRKATPILAEAVQALGTLGLPQTTARKAVEKALKTLGENAELEDVVRAALTAV